MSDQRPDNLAALDRYDLTGKRLSTWREPAREKLLARIGRWLQELGQRKAPGKATTLGEEAEGAAGSAIDFGKAHLEKPVLENQVRQQEVEKGFLENETRRLELSHAEELKRLEIRQKTADVRAQEIENDRAEVKLMKELGELVGDRPWSIGTDADGQPCIVLARVVLPRVEVQKLGSAKVEEAGGGEADAGA